jgi:hypothetical protein
MQLSINYFRTATLGDTVLTRASLSTSAAPPKFTLSSHAIHGGVPPLEIYARSASMSPPPKASKVEVHMSDADV